MLEAVVPQRERETGPLRISGLLLEMPEAPGPQCEQVWVSLEQSGWGRCTRLETGFLFQA